MESVFAIVVGLFFAASIYLMLSPHLVRILLGVSIFGNGVNLFIFTSGRLTEAAPPVLSDNGYQPQETAGIADQGEGALLSPIQPMGPGGEPISGTAGVGETASAVLDAFPATANPLPQALILTAIVISFSIFAFLLVLTFRAYQGLETDNVDDMRVAESEPRLPPLGF